MAIKSLLVAPHNEEQVWTFTFGVGHTLFAGMYIDIFGTFEGARDVMFAIFGTNWSSQYLSHEDAGVSKYCLEEIKTKLEHVDFR